VWKRSSGCQKLQRACTVQGSEGRGHLHDGLEACCNETSTAQYIIYRRRFVTGTNKRHIGRRTRPSEAVRRVVRFRKKPLNLCVLDSKDRKRGVGAGVNVTMISETL
jgi:hypothetical protein